MRALTPRQVPPTAVCGTQTMTMRQAKSRRDDPTTPLYAMSGFYITIGISINIVVLVLCKVSAGFTFSLARHKNRTDFGVKTGAMLRFSQLTNSQLFW